MAYISCDGIPSDSFVIVHHTFDMNMNLKCSLEFSFIVDLSLRDLGIWTIFINARFRNLFVIHDSRMLL